VAMLTKAYRMALDCLSAGQPAFDKETMEDIEKESPRALGIGTFRFRQSMNSI